jgi:hypothetical protein
VRRHRRAPVGSASTRPGVHLALRPFLFTFRLRETTSCMVFSPRCFSSRPCWRRRSKKFFWLLVSVVILVSIVGHRQATLHPAPGASSASATAGDLGRLAYQFFSSADSIRLRPENPSRCTNAVLQWFQVPDKGRLIRDELLPPDSTGAARNELFRPIS